MLNQDESNRREVEGRGSLGRFANQCRGRHTGLPLLLDSRISCFLVFSFLSLTLLTATGCGGSLSSIGGATLTLGAYTTPREAYSKAIIPEFKKYWKAQTGQEVEFQESYQASGAQSRAITSGFEADIAALSLEEDVTRIAEAGLISHDWQANQYQGIVSTSLVVIAV